MRRVDAAGRITTVAGGGHRDLQTGCLRGPVPARSVVLADVIDLLALPAGDLLIVDAHAGVLHLADGQLTQILCAGGREAGDHWALDRRYHDANLDGRPADRSRASFDSVAIGADGTLAIATASATTEYLAMLPVVGHVGRLGIAITPRTHATVGHGRVHVAATRPASITLRVVHDDTTLITVRQRVPAGSSVVRLLRRLPPGMNVVVVSARTQAGQRAADRLRTIVPGPHGLDIASVRRLILREIRPSAYRPHVKNCRAVTSRAVTCTYLDSRFDNDRAQWTIRRARDGTLQATVKTPGERPLTFEVQP